MIVLALDTTGPDCSVCLFDSRRADADQVRAYRSERIGRGHAERLAPMVADAFADAALSPIDVDRIAVCTGPGSFTGLRVALSLAKGFALPRRLPVLGLSALSVTYLMSQPDQTVMETVFKDVKRGQFMYATFSSAYPPQTGYPKVGTFEDVEREAKVLALDVVESTFVDVRVMARAVAGLDPADFPAEPLYARAPDAKLPGGVTPPAP